MMLLLFQRILKSKKILGSDSESSIEAVVVPKRQKRANTMIGDISKGKYSRS